jgi:hypothetical protein
MGEVTPYGCQGYADRGDLKVGSCFEKKAVVMGLVLGLFPNRVLRW